MWFRFYVEFVIDKTNLESRNGKHVMIFFLLLLFQVHEVV